MGNDLTARLFQSHSRINAAMCMTDLVPQKLIQSANEGIFHGASTLFAHGGSHL